MLCDAFAINDETQIQAMVDQMIPVLESALSDFKIFLDANTENASFRLWNDYLEFVSTSSGLNVMATGLSIWKCSRKCSH